MTRILQAGVHALLTNLPCEAKAAGLVPPDPKPLPSLFPTAEILERAITRAYEESLHLFVTADAEARLSQQRDLIHGTRSYDSSNPGAMRALGYRDAGSVERHRDFDIRLHAGIEKKIEPAKLLALANGYINGTLSKERFMRTVRLLEKPQSERRIQDITALGFPWHLRTPLMLGDWAIIGLMNGVIKHSDYDSIPLETMQLTEPAFWAERFPGSVDAQGMQASSLPPLRAEDWAHIGSYDVRPPDDGERTPGRYPITLNTMRAGAFGYNDALHYLACVASARCQSAPVGPIGGYKDRASATKAFFDLFWHGQTPKERATFSPCVIV